MDVISAYTHGITNVVAAMGTAITSSNAHLISRMAKNIILCFDGDDAGIMAANACTNELLKLDVFPSIVVLDKAKGKDPDEYIKDMDVILCATISHKNSVINMYPELKEKVFTMKEYAGYPQNDLDIKDPWGYGIEVYKSCAKEIKECLNKIIEKL